MIKKNTIGGYITMDLSTLLNQTLALNQRDLVIGLLTLLVDNGILDRKDVIKKLCVPNDDFVINGLPMSEFIKKED